MSVPTGSSEYDRRPRSSNRLHHHFFTNRYGSAGVMDTIEKILLTGFFVSMFVYVVLQLLIAFAAKGC
jgi:hypothetical protein